jgi:hypothetical protein
MRCNPVLSHQLDNTAVTAAAPTVGLSPSTLLSAMSAKNSFWNAVAEALQPLLMAFPRPAASATASRAIKPEGLVLFWPAVDVESRVADSIGHRNWTNRVPVRGTRYSKVSFGSIECAAKTYSVCSILRSRTPTTAITNAPVSAALEYAVSPGVEHIQRRCPGDLVRGPPDSAPAVPPLLGGVGSCSQFPSGANRTPLRVT